MKGRELTNEKNGVVEKLTQDEAYMFLPEFINKIVTYIPLVVETKFPENITHLIFFFDVLNPMSSTFKV
jgi:hypothetical protein